MDDKPKDQAKKSKTTSIIIGIAIVVVLSVIGYLNKDQLFPSPSPAQIGPTNITPDQRSPTTILASVNGEQITLKQVKLNQDIYLNQLGIPLSEAAVLNQTINELLLVQEAKKQGLGLTDIELNRLTDGWIEEIKAGRNDTEFAAELARDGLTEAGLREQSKKVIETQTLVNRILNTSVITELRVDQDEITNYYEQFPDKFAAKEGQIRARHILVQSEDKARNLFKRLIENKTQWDNWDYIVKEYSLDYATVPSKGDLGIFGKSTTPSAMEQTIFTLKIGEISEPIQSNKGWHIFERLPDRYTLAETNQTIYNFLFAQKEQRAAQLFLAQLRKRATIIYGNEETKPVSSPQEKTPVPLLINESTQASTPPSTYCTDDQGNIAVDFFTSSNCKSCKEVLRGYRNEMKSQLSLSSSIWELDTGDNLATSLEEKGVPKVKADMFLSMSPDGSLPLIVLGCATPFRDVDSFTKSLLGMNT